MWRRKRSSREKEESKEENVRMCEEKERLGNVGREEEERQRVDWREDM